MSTHHDRIQAALDLCETNEDRSCALAFLTGYLASYVSPSEGGKRSVSAEKLAEAFEKAANNAMKWRSVATSDLPEPREIPDLDPTHFSHAMTGPGKETSWCGAPGPVAVFAFSVTCPVCRTMLSREEEGDPMVRTLGPAVSPLADDTSASGETAPAEIIHAPHPVGNAATRNVTRCGLDRHGVRTALRVADATCPDCTLFQKPTNADPATQSTGDPGGPYWLVRYVKGQSERQELSLAVAAGDAMTAGRSWAKWSPEENRAIDVHGPFDSREAAYTHRSAWQETGGSR